MPLPILWLHTAIPQFQVLVHELHEFLERIYEHVGRRTKRAVARVSRFSLGWMPSHTDAFDRSKAASAQGTTLAHLT